MSDYINKIIAQVKAKNSNEPEFHQAVEEVCESLEPVFARHPEYQAARILERMVEPETYYNFSCTLDGRSRRYSNQPGISCANE